MIALHVRVAREHAETVLAELTGLAPGGLEERDAGDAVEYVLYGAPGELPALPDLRAAAGDALVDITTEEVADDWAERWKAFHRPVDVGPLRVRPPWEPPREGALDLVVDPGQAFGTGGHHTTRLCLELLLERRGSGTPGTLGALADWGCGTGVLALAAARLGWTPVSAVDVDPAATEATHANARANGVELAVDRVDLRRAPGPWAPTVVANLVRPLLLDVARVMDRPPDALIVSGLLREEAGEIAAAFAPHGLRETARRSSGEWSALLLVRTAGRAPAVASDTVRP